VHKYGKARYEPYTHLELESLPTGGWGYNHFPSSARYAARLGFDFVSHTGKFHTSWGEFGGFKHPDALDYECAIMVALGSKCLIGDQLHPSGQINADTYGSIAQAYRRIEALEPYLRGAEQISEIAILTSEYFDRSGTGPRQAVDDGAVQMLLELQRPFDIIDPEMDFDRHRLIILPDTIPVDAGLKVKLEAYLAKGGKLLLSGTSGRDPATGAYALDTGLAVAGGTVPFMPCYAQVTAAGADSRLPRSPFVVYAPSQTLSAVDAEVLAEIRLPYFNRTFAHFCSHQHAPDDLGAAAAGVAAAIKGAIGTLSFAVFTAYRGVGQPLYKYLVDMLINRLMPAPAIETTLPSAGRVSLTYQAGERRVIAHVMFGAPQVRGQAVYAAWDKAPRPIEMIEDVPTLGPVTVRLRLKGEPTGVHDAASGAALAWRRDAEGAIVVDLPDLHIHRAIVIDGTSPG